MITSLDAARTYLGIPSTDATKDEKILLLIDKLELFLADYGGWNEMVVLQLIEYHLNNINGKDAESLGNYSVTYSKDYPESITRSLRRKARFV